MKKIAEMIAGIRLDEVEHRMHSNPEGYPSYTNALEAERILTQALIKKYGMEKVELDQLVSTLSAQGGSTGHGNVYHWFSRRRACCRNFPEKGDIG